MRTGVGALAAALALAAADPLAAQDDAPVIFGDDVFDVTGAGTFAAGDIDAVLRPFRDRAGGAGLGTLEFELVIDRAGSVQDCRTWQAVPTAAERAMCDHLRTAGRFTVDPLLVLDFSRATYHLKLGGRFQPAPGESEFAVFDTVYPLQLQSVAFGEDAIPPEEQRLARSDLEFAPLTYPRLAAREEVMGRTAVLLTFDVTGAVATCRPIRSSDTARLAYDTCFAARDSVRLRQPPDPRSFLFSVVWSLN